MTPIQIDTERYEPAAQFSRTTGISTSTLSKLRMRGSGPPYVKIGRSVRYPVQAGLEWMAAHTRRSTSEIQTEAGTRKTRRRNAIPANVSAVV
jgi:predicted DNA-binding transcriptional regulator AlpA